MAKALKIVFVVYCFLTSSIYFSQTNLVPNPSFEDIILCPFSFGLESYTTYWKSARNSPDYFNKCSAVWFADIPMNDYGYQLPYSGNAYIGMLTYRSDSSLYTEATSVQLTTPLSIGQTYYVSFRLSLTLENSTGSMVANNKIGIQFSTNEYSPFHPSPVNNFAHVWTDSIITDSLNWSIVKGSFVADSNYTYLSLGNFFDKPFIDSIIYGPAFGAYYYFDDVCVSLDSTTCYEIIGIEELSKPSFSIYPNPTSRHLTIDFPKYINSGEASFYDVNGKEVLKLKVSGKNSQIDLGHLPDGLYYIKIYGDNLNYNYKILKDGP